MRSQRSSAAPITTGRVASRAASSRRAVVSHAARIRPFDLLIISLVLVYVWRIQDLFPLLSAVQFPILTSLCALAVFLLGGYARSAWPRFKTEIIAATTFILIWMALSVPGSVYQGLSFRFIVDDHIKTFLMMLMVVASIRTFADVERLALVSVLGAGIYCLKILTTLEVGENGRLGELFYYDANDLAMMVVCTLPIAVYFVRTGARNWQRLVAVGCCVAFVLAIMRTGSRGGFLGLIAVATFMLFAFRTIPTRTRVAAVIGAGLLLFTMAGPGYWRMMGTLLDPKADYNWSGNNDVGRMAIWERGIGYMARSPVVGIGVNAFPVAEGKISEISQRQQLGIGLKWSAAHNSFVQIGAELGVPGLVAFLLLLWRAFRTGWRIGRGKAHAATGSERALGEALAATLVGYVVSGFFLSQAYAAYLYAVCGILTGLAVVARDPKFSVPSRAADAQRQVWSRRSTSTRQMSMPRRP